MRIVVDGYWWDAGPPSGRLVLRDIVHSWASMNPGDTLYVVKPRIKQPSPSEHANIKFIDSFFAFHPATNLIELPARAFQLGDIDVILCQNFASPWSASHVFIHDMIFADHPQWFTRKENVYLRLVKVMARMATTIFTSSATEASRLHRHLPRTSTAVLAVGLGLSSNLVNSVSTRPRELSTEVDGFILSVGRLNIRKNLTTTIDACIRAKAISRHQPLVVVGTRDGQDEHLSDAANEAINDGAVVFLGYAPDGALRWLYEHCALMVFMSHDEGFGMPPLEASFFGSPVVVSDISVFRETLGTNAVYADPNNVEDVASAVSTTLRGGRPSGEAIEVRYPNFSWSVVVAKIRTTAASYAEGGIR